jgi:mediator of RNA polymerase II transcription subunit 12
MIVTFVDSKVITLECSSALVWNHVGQGRIPNSPLHGSPLDCLPVPPSVLPLPSRPNNDEVRRELRLSEDLIRRRSAVVESMFANPATETQRVGATTRRVVKILETLDRHSFNMITNANCFDTLYQHIFHPSGKDSAHTPEVRNTSTFINSVVLKYSISKNTF